MLELTRPPIGTEDVAGYGWAGRAAGVRWSVAETSESVPGLIGRVRKSPPPWRFTSTKETEQMPQVKRSPAGVRRPASPSQASGSASTRREVEQASERFETALGEANQALKTLARNVGQGADVAYKDLAKALKTLRRDAAKTNRQLAKDLATLAASVRPEKAAAKPARKSAAASPRSRSAAKKSGPSREKKA